MEGKKVENEKLLQHLDRIAFALERIANVLENKFAAPFDSELSGDTQFEKPDASIDSEETIESNELAVQKDKMEQFLESRNIKIKRVPPEDAADDVINSLAEFLGDHYDGLQSVYRMIRRNMQKGSFFTVSVKGEPQQTISDICLFCNRLHGIAFLEQYKYFKSPQFLIKAKATTLPKAQNFFSGLWLERYVMQKVKNAVNSISVDLQREIDFSYLINPQIILPNGDDFELDFLFNINETFYWIEAKTGDYQQHISKYSKMSKLLGLDYKHAIMVLPDIDKKRAEALTSLFSMMVYTLEQLEGELISTIREDLNL